MLLNFAVWWLCALTRVNTHLNTFARAHYHHTSSQHNMRGLLINFIAGKRERGMGKSEGLMGSWEVQARWLKTQATDVLEHIKVVCLPGPALGLMHYWDGAHLAPGADITWPVHLAPWCHVGDTLGHTSSHKPSSQCDEGHWGKRSTCSTSTSKALNWGMCSL